MPGIRLWSEIRALRESGRTTVLTTHNLDEADALADRVVVIHNGRRIAEGTPGGDQVADGGAAGALRHADRA